MVSSVDDWEGNRLRGRLPLLLLGVTEHGGALWPLSREGVSILAGSGVSGAAGGSEVVGSPGAAAANAAVAAARTRSCLLALSSILFQPSCMAAIAALTVCSTSVRRGG